MNTLDKLKTLSSAEEFFQVLDVPYRPEVLRVARLHILRRMGEYLSVERFEPDVEESTIREFCRNTLAQAYSDFVVSSPLEQRVFKVLKDAVKPKQRAFVPLTALTR